MQSWHTTPTTRRACASRHLRQSLFAVAAVVFGTLLTLVFPVPLVSFGVVMHLLAARIVVLLLRAAALSTEAIVSIAGVCRETKGRPGLRGVAANAVLAVAFACRACHMSPRPCRDFRRALDQFAPLIVPYLMPVAALTRWRFAVRPTREEVWPLARIAAWNVEQESLFAFDDDSCA